METKTEGNENRLVFDMLRKGLVLLILTGLIHYGIAQDVQIQRIHDLVTEIDQKVFNQEFVGASFQDDYGNETMVRVFMQTDHLLKLEAISSNLGGSIQKTYYFSSSKLIMVDVVELDHPGLPNWEEAKSDELGAEELRRVQTVIKNESRFYLQEGVVFKSLSESDLDGAQQGQILMMEVDALLRQLD